MTTRAQIPLVVIAGPTASGKSAIAHQLARRYNGEILCSDSRTIYKGMDIGTAKPSLADQADVPYWGLDLVRPDQPFSAADFQAYAKKMIADIRSRGHLPIMVGGTGLYIEGVVHDYAFKKVDPELRERLSNWTLEQLHEYCANNNIDFPENTKNRRYVQRKVEMHLQGDGLEATQKTLPPDTLLVGIATDRDELRQRIAARADDMFAAGVIEEAVNLANIYGWENEAMTGNIYRLARRYVDGEITRQEYRELFIIADAQLAKRQTTYLRRNPQVTWLSRDEALPNIASWLEQRGYSL